MEDSLNTEQKIAVPSRIATVSCEIAQLELVLGELLKHESMMDDLENNEKFFLNS